MAVDTLTSQREGGRLFAPRLGVVAWLVHGVLALLCLRLWVLQGVRGDELRHKSRRNFVQATLIAHDRGIIYDRRGRILADNQ